MVVCTFAGHREVFGLGQSRVGPITEVPSLRAIWHLVDGKGVALRRGIDGEIRIFPLDERHIRHGLVAAVLHHIGPHPVKADFLCHTGEAFQYHGITPQPFHAGEVLHKIILARLHMENIGGAHTVLAFHAQRQMGVIR